MKATGIVRRIDDLGRIVIPKEIRRKHRIKEGDPMEIFTSDDGNLTLRKYSMVKELEDFAVDYAQSLQSILDARVLITDANMIVAAPYQHQYKYKDITQELQDLIQYKDIRVLEANETTTNIINICIDDDHKYVSQIIVPIISNGEAIGFIILFSENEILKEENLLAAKIAADFLGKQMKE